MLKRAFIMMSLGAAAALAAAPGAGGAQQGGMATDELLKRTAEVGALPGEPTLVERAGISRGDRVLPSLESAEPVESGKKRLVLVGGLDGNDRSVDAVLNAIRWWKTAAPAALKQQWSVTALICGNPEGLAQLKPTNDSGGKPAVNYPPETGFFNDKVNVEARYIWRWIAIQAPDLVVETRGATRLSWLAPAQPAPLRAALGAQPLSAPDSLPLTLGMGAPSGLGTTPAVIALVRAAEGPRMLEQALQAGSGLPISPMRQAAMARIRRPIEQTAQVLAARYPQTPSVGYIPAVAWSARLSLSKLTGDAGLRTRVVEALRPWLSGEKPALASPPSLVNLAGHIAFGDLALDESQPEELRASARKLVMDAALNCRPEKPGERARPGQFWTDDMFMQNTLLRRAAQLGDPEASELMVRTLKEYLSKLQRQDGIFVHALDGPHAWGRGNGFAALGMMEALTQIPKTHPERSGIEAACRRHVEALTRVQSPEGAWRQVIDHRESYREVTATAMNLSAIARGIRLGWLGREHVPTAERAWRALSARIGDDGALLDVCTGTGSGPTLRYYLERQAIIGPDDRGGAMALLAATELMALRRSLK